ncbi:peroxiredoxin [Flindersiella endophytica]
MSAHDPTSLPTDLPVPSDDGAADHLPGAAVPSLLLPATTGSSVSLLSASQSERVVVFCYPKTGRPGVAPAPGWDSIPGARGCTPEACAFRDLKVSFDALNVAIFGLSTQPTPYQQEAASRLHLPYPLLSDASLALTTALRLPSMIVEGETLLRRTTLVLDAGAITHVFYPVFPPDTHAEAVLAWLSDQPH